MPQKTRILLSGDTIAFETNKNGGSFDELQTGEDIGRIRFELMAGEFDQVGITHFVKAGSIYPDPPSAGQAWSEWIVIEDWLSGPLDEVPVDRSIDKWNGSSWALWRNKTHPTDTKTTTTVT